MSPPEPAPLPKFEDYPNLYGWTTQNERGYKIQERPCGAMRPMRVIHIGAGLSGICLAKLMPDALKNVALTCYDKNSDIGGTWFENVYVALPPLKHCPCSCINIYGARYPGCGCDIPSANYQVCIHSVPTHLSVILVGTSNPNPQR